jgi:very-short-patch-repair endonuclease
MQGHRGHYAGSDHCRPASGRLKTAAADFLWRDRWLIAETDGYRYHRGRLAFEEDHARDAELSLLGYEVVRFTYRQVTGDRGGVAAVLSAKVARNSLDTRGKRHSRA